MQSVFDRYGVDGCMVIHDLNAGTWIYSDQDKANIGTIPASTFKIVHSLIALEENVVARSEYMKWNGVDNTFKGRSVKAWNRDLNLENAFKSSAIWFFVELSKRIKRNTCRTYLKACHYGNLCLDEAGDDFWNYGNMEVSPIHQVAFLVDLYTLTLPFNTGNMALIKSFMLLEEKRSYRLSGKTGWGIKDGRDIGWFTGYLEANGNVYVFATRLCADSNNLPGNFGEMRYSTSMEIFKQLGILE